MLKRLYVGKNHNVYSILYEQNIRIFTSSEEDKTCRSRSYKFLFMSIHLSGQPPSSHGIWLCLTITVRGTELLKRPWKTVFISKLLKSLWKPLSLRVSLGKVFLLKANCNDKCFANKITYISVTQVVSFFSYVILGVWGPQEQDRSRRSLHSPCPEWPQHFFYAFPSLRIHLSLSNLQDSEYLEGHCSTIFLFVFPTNTVLEYY